MSVFLPKLADHTCILPPLTTKESKTNFLEWNTVHEAVFEAIKALVVSAKCLTMIDHNCPRDNNIFMTCDASNWRIGATLSFGPTWETACPVTFISMQLKPAKNNYPVHKKELLVIIQALKKWQVDLLSPHFQVYTDTVH